MFLKSSTVATLTLGFVISTYAQAPANPPPPREGGPPFNAGPGGPGGPGGFGGFGMGQERALVTQFDKDGNKRLNAEERKAAREFLDKERAEGRGPRGFGGRRGFGPGGRGGENQTPPQPGPKVSQADVKKFQNEPLYDAKTLRTFFLEFESADWEKELIAFNNTDVEVPAKLTVDGKTYENVGVHVRGMSSSFVGEGQKHSLNLTLDFIDEKQNLGGYRTLNLLNSHEDPSQLRAVLYLQIARDYIPAPKANFARVVINGESWGIFPNVQQFNKEFVQDFFGTTKGARWKAPGSPGGRATLAYLGDDPAQYKNVYSIKTKDDKKSWASLINLCKVLDQTPPDQLEKALEPILDLNGALKFLALENTLINNDGYWIRTSDYSLYQDEKGRFHIFPHDANETFGRPGGGPGFGGGRGGGPGGFLAPAIFSQADKNTDQKVTKEEFTALADAWFEKLDADKAGKLNQEQFAVRFGEVLPPPQGFGPPGGGPPPAPGRGGFGPAGFVAPALFTAVDADKDGSLTLAELREVFGKWFSEWDADKSTSLNEEKLRNGLAAALPMQNFLAGGRGAPGGPDGGRGGRGGGRGPGGPGFGNMPPIEGVKLDPLLAANDQNKPLIAKLLAVPALRQRYLSYTKDIAEKWLDWRKLGPIAEEYRALIAEDVKKDTRKLDSTEAFERSFSTDMQSEGGGPSGGRGGHIGLKSFADQRRAYLLDHPEIKKLSQ